MEQKQITLEKVYEEVRLMSKEIHEIKEKLENEEAHKISDWEGNEKAFADEKLLAESWLSPEDEKAFAYLQ